MFFNSQQAKGKHLKSVKIGVLLFIVFVLSYVTPLIVLRIGIKLPGHFVHVYHINNLANFFIYLVVDEEFRVKLKAMCKRSRE